MILPSKEEIEGTIEALRKKARQVKKNHELAKKVMASIENRILTTQPELSPKQRSERLLKSGVDSAS